MIAAPASSPTPTPTPAPTLASAYGLGLGLQPRATDYLDYDTSCYYNVNGLQCTTILTGCYDAFLSESDYDEAASTCYCNYGISYLDCYYSQVATGSCASYFFTGDYAEFQMSFYTEYCGSIPPSAMAHITPPASVSLALKTVDVVTATGALEQPDYNAPALYQGSGELLQGRCRETGFTLVDAGNTVYYAGLMGCNMASPECCPWAVATAASSSAGKDNVDYAFPQPAATNLAQLAKCADDYYSISGGCCPIGFWPFTAAVGGITPCWSSVSSVEPPTLTVQKDAQTLDKPTSAVVNIIWSMRYTLESGHGGLSTAAKAGIAAGAGVAAILIAGLAICLWRSRRENKKLSGNQPSILPVLLQQPPQPQQKPHFQQTPMKQYLPELGGQPAYGGYPPAGMMVSPSSTLSPPSDRTSVVTTLIPTSAAALIPQHTGASNGPVSELNSQSDRAGGYFAGAAAVNPRVSSGTCSPPTGAANGQDGYPAPIAEADEGQAQYHGQYQYQHYHQQQHHQQFYDQGRGAGYYPPAHPQGHPQQQGGHVYLQQPQQQRQGYQTNVPGISANREVDSPQEVMGSQGHYGIQRR